MYRCEQHGCAVDPEALGVAIAENLLAQGGDKVLALLGIHA
jgi:hypothetical protein